MFQINKSIFATLFAFLLVWTNPVVSQSEGDIPEELTVVTNLSADKLDSIFKLFEGTGIGGNGNFINGTAIPVYGNWCGPNYGSGVPIDAVDAACRTHDLCYVQNGYFDCRCDNQLVKNLRKAVKQSSNPRTKAAGSLIGEFFSKFPCLCRKTVKCGTGCNTCTELNGLAQYPCDCATKTGNNKCPASIPTKKNTRCK